MRPTESALMPTLPSNVKLPYRLAATDLDGTLLGPDKEVSPQNAEAVRRLQAAGIRVILASGRRHQNSIRFQRQLGLHGPIIACQGGLIRDGETGSVLEAHFMEKALAAAIVEAGQRLGVQVIYYQLDHLYVGPERDQYLDLYERRVGEVPEAVPELRELHGHKALKVVWYGAPEVLKAERPGLTERFQGQVDVLSTEKENLEFMPPGVSKGSALAKVAKAFGLTAEEVITFGDGENDVSMLEWAGLGVAMYHGNDAAKAAAKLVSPQGPPESDFARAVSAVLTQPTVA
ncbi:MAG TPA: Cof-type HAD-IIB family hydrolase [Chthoniobacterales bacterium]